MSYSDAMSSALHRLAAWYSARCDGEWEHGYGLTIGTADNPGFTMEINLTGTPWEHADFEALRDDIDSDDRWLSCRKDDLGNFQGACAPGRVEDMIECFLDWTTTVVSETSIVTGNASRQMAIEELCAAITNENLHPESKWGDPRGNEAW